MLHALSAGGVVDQTARVVTNAIDRDRLCRNEATFFAQRSVLFVVRVGMG